MNTKIITFLVLVSQAFGTIFTDDVKLTTDGKFLQLTNNSETIDFLTNPSASESQTWVFPAEKGTVGQTWIIDSIDGDVVTWTYGPPSPVDPAYDLVYLRLDTTNDPLTGDLDFGGKDILSSGALDLMVSGDNDDNLSFSAVGNIPTTTIIGGPFWDIRSDLPDVGTAITLKGTDGSLSLTWDDINEQSQITSTDPLIITSGVGDDITFIPGPGGVVNITSLATGILPTASNHLATKEYVDTAQSFIFEFFYNNTASDIGGIYFEMLDASTGEAESSFTSGSLGSGDDQALFNFANVSGFPGVTILETGIYSGHIHAEKTAGIKPVKLHFEIYIREPNTVETLIATSEESDFLSLNPVDHDHFELHATVSEEIMINTTDRIVVKWLANVDAAGSNATVVLYAEGDTGARLEIPTSTEVLNAIYVRQDGTTPLLANWDAGSFNIRAQTLTADSISSTRVVFASANGLLVGDGDLTFDSGTGVLTVLGLGTGGQTDYDLKVGDTDGSPTYGMIQIGNSCIGRTSFNAGDIDLDGSMIYRNIAGPVTSEIEHVFVESTGDTTRFALAKAGVGNATYNSRSMLIAGPAPADTDYVKVTYWQTNNSIFDNLVCDTSGVGADLGVQNDLEVEGDIFVDSIKESTTSAGITIGGELKLGSNNITGAGNITGTDVDISAGTGDYSSSGTLSAGAITGTSFIIGAANISEAELEILDGATVTTVELNYLDGTTLGTATANNVLAVDASKDIDLDGGELTTAGATITGNSNINIEHTGPAVPGKIIWDDGSFTGTIEPRILSGNMIGGINFPEMPKFSAGLLFSSFIKGTPVTIGSGSANAQWTAAGALGFELKRMTSSQRYKQDNQPLDYDTSYIYELDVHQYREKDSILQERYNKHVANDPNDPWRPPLRGPLVTGVIAEEVYAIAPNSTIPLRDKDGFPVDGEVDGVDTLKIQYDSLVELQKLKARVDVLESQRPGVAAIGVGGLLLFLGGIAVALLLKKKIT